MPNPVARLVQITDTHQFSAPDELMRGTNTHQSFMATLEYATPFVAAADAILLTGDIAQDEAGDTYRQLVKTMTPLKKPIWCLPGNHDNPMEMSHILDSGIFSYLSHHRLGNWEIILLDSHKADSPAGLLGDDEIARLSHRLNETTADFVLICLHHHPVSVHSAWLDRVALIDAEEFFEVIAPHEKVRGVCFGHIHQSTDVTIDNTRFFSSPSTCTQFAPLSNDFALDHKPPGFRWIKLYENGELKTDVVWVKVAASVPESSSEGASS